MYRTAEEHQLELFTPALARFDPPAIVQRAVLATVPRRTSLQLRQLSWQSVELSAIFDQSTLAVFRDAYESLIDHQDRYAGPDRNWVAASIARCLFPHLPAESEEHTSELQSLRHLVCRLL